MSDDFLRKINDNNSQPIILEGNMYLNLFTQYERVVIQSLITSFGLDFINFDQHGGDVDTVHNVRQIGVDPNMRYKNTVNKLNFEKKEAYEYSIYHNEQTFRTIKHNARERFQETGTLVKDSYTEEYTGFYGHSKNIPDNKKTELDHIIECKSIHDDRGRVLSGLSGISLANAPENLAFTNKSLNASMGAWARGVNDAYKKEHGTDAPMEMVDIKTYVDAHPNLDETTRKNLLKHYRKAKKAYDAKINYAYYTSPKFWKDSTAAALQGGFKMGARQALGLVFSEIWFSTRDVIAKHRGDGRSLFTNIKEGVKLGIANAMSKYNEVVALFKDGVFAGTLSSITTTLCNIFFTTTKRLVRIMRQCWASLVEATKIVLINPDFLPLGERMLAATKIIATGASIVTGTLISEAIATTALGHVPVIGEIAQTFCGTLVAGIMSCSLLYLLDNNKVINFIVEKINHIPTVDDIVTNLKQQSEYLYALSAQMVNIDIESFKKEVNAYCNAVKCILESNSEISLNQNLKMVFDMLEIKTPWEACNKNNCHELMSDKSAIIIFK